MTSPSPVPRAATLLAALVLAAAAQSQMQASFAERLHHWAWQPLRDTEPPAVADASWPRDPLDRYVLQALEAKGLRPAAPAAPAVWLRRVWFDLVGLPPEPAAVAAFVADPSPAARERVVDALLAMPAFGERWARHWLDVVRYAESLGHEFDFDVPDAWRYRDYVVRAYADDVPFPVFAQEQIAGDLLPQPRLDPRTGADESMIATGFWWFAEQTHGPVDAEKHRADRIDNQLDVFGKAFLGVTVACARCHDHKFDAVRSADYYALYGFLKSTQYVPQPAFKTAPEAIAITTSAHRRLAVTASALAGGEGALPHGELDASLASCRRSGDAFGKEPWSGPFVVGGDDDELRFVELEGAWCNSATLAPSRDGALVSPTMTLDGDYLHVEVAGHGARLQIVVDGLHLVRDPLYGKLHRAVDDPAPHWATFDVRAWRGHTAQLQALDVRVPDLADPDRDRERYPDDAWIAVARIAATSAEKPPAAPRRGRNFTIARGDAELERAHAEWQRAIALLPQPATTPAAIDGDGEDERVFFRGDHRQRRQPAPRRFLEAIDGDSALPLPKGSGRLQLADRVFAATNPLPARVFANRIWHHLFGKGLVRTVDNLGHLGDQPVHQDLLDHLARAAVAGGWSHKQLVRRIVLSATYAQDSRGDEATETADPDNRLLHRHELRRLEGEALRDAMLAFADRLDQRQFGPSVPVPLDADDKARGRPEQSGPIDGDGRRSVYLAIRRNFLPDLLVAFDLPTPFTTVGARSTANVPGQALTLLNDPFVHAMCRLAADHLLADAPDGDTDEAAIARWYVAAFARMPTPAELAQCARHLATVRSDLGCDRDDARPWASLAHALLLTKEYRYLR